MSSRPKTVKFHTGASWLEPHFKYAKEKCGLHFYLPGAPTKIMPRSW